MSTATLDIPTSTIPDDPDERALLPGYDAYGNPNNRYLPGHPWADADDLCGRIRDWLELTLAGHSIDQVRRETELHPQAQGRLRRHIGIGEDRDGRLVERWPGALTAARDKLTAIDADPDLTLGVLRAGLAWPHRHPGAPELLPRVPVHHPAAVAVRKEWASLTATTGLAA